MKAKLSISLEKALVEKAKALVEGGKFRNQSHVIEYALMLFLEKI